MFTGVDVLCVATVLLLAIVVLQLYYVECSVDCPRGVQRSCASFVTFDGYSTYYRTGVTVCQCTAVAITASVQYDAPRRTRGAARGARVIQVGMFQPRGQYTV